jgi:hypothetical protein
MKDHPWWRQYGQVAAAAAVLWYAVIAWLIRVPAITTGNDDANYLALADALRHFTYRDTYLVGAPFHAQYPPGYPTFVALLDLLPGDLLTVLHAANVLLVIIAMLAIADVVRQRWSPVLGLAVLFVCASNLALAYLPGKVMAEPLYLSLSAGALWVSARPTRKGTRYLTGLSAIAAALTRSIGLTLVVATGLHWLSQREWRTVAWFGLAAAGTVGLWMAWTVFAPDLPAGRSYIADAVILDDGKNMGAVGQMGIRVWENLSQYLSSSLPHVLGVPTAPGTPIDNLFWIITLAVLIPVGLVSFGRAWPLAAWYVVVYGALLAVWPWTTSRFLVSLIPMLVATLVVGLQALGARYAAPRQTTIVGVFASVLVLTGGIRQVQSVADYAPCRVEDTLAAPGCFSPEQHAYLSGARYAADALPANAVIVAAKEATFGHYSSRRVYSLWRLETLAQEPLPSHLEGAGITHVFLGRMKQAEWGLALWLRKVCQGFELEQAFTPHTYLFRVAPDAVPGDNRNACEAISAYLDNPLDLHERVR